MRGRDKGQQSSRPRGIRAQARAWWSRHKHTPSPEHGASDLLKAHPLDVQAAVRALPALMDGTRLPNGVVELVIEGNHSHERCVFDIHDGAIAPVQPGSSVPWTSIAGTREAWLLALRDGSASELRLTGDERLAQRVLGALPRLAADQVRA